MDTLTTSALSNPEQSSYKYNFGPEQSSYKYNFGPEPSRDIRLGNNIAELRYCEFKPGP
jgi:hypothetical protein